MVLLLATTHASRAFAYDDMTHRLLATDSLAADVGNRLLAPDSLAGSAARADSLAASVARTDSLAGSRVRTDTLVSFPPPRVRAWQVGLVRGDRLEHASLSFALASAFIIVTRNRAAGAATAFAFGLGKELYDGRTTFFDPVDLAADAVGVALATVLVAPRGP